MSLTQPKKWKIWSYATLIFCLGAYTLLLLSWERGSLTVERYALPVAFAFFGAAVCRGGVRGEVWAGPLFLLWFVVSRMLLGENYLETSSLDFALMAPAYLVALPFAFSQEGEQRKRGLRVFCWFISLSAAVLAWVGVATAMTRGDITLPVFGTPFMLGMMENAALQCLQQFLDEAHRNKQLTIYCHPQWSGTFAREFERLQGNFAMELWNSGCVMEDGVDFNNGPLWDELLCQGKRIFGVATDDGHAMEQHCRGWVRVNAQKNVNDILRALREGAFYASTGPEIYDFYIDDNKVAHVKCSPCATVKFFCSRVTKLLRSEDGSPITEMAMECPVRDDLFYLRVEVTDADGHVAWSNPIFLEEMK
mgnify:CR=1 FL=1